VGGTLAGTLEGSNGSGSGATMLWLNKMDLVSEECARELRKQYPEAVMIGALEGCDALLEEMYRSIASGRTRNAAASGLYRLAEIHAQENTTAGMWMHIGLPRSAAARYAPYKTWVPRSCRNVRLCTSLAPESSKALPAPVTRTVRGRNDVRRPRGAAVRAPRPFEAVRDRPHGELLGRQDRYRGKICALRQRHRSAEHARRGPPLRLRQAG
jgi:hypothetical protein